jgi:DNA-binding MarR family transcriptional regulator
MGLLTREMVNTNYRTMRLVLTDAGGAVQQAGCRALEKLTAELAGKIPQDLHEKLVTVLAGLHRDIRGKS